MLETIERLLKQIKTFNSRHESLASDCLMGLLRIMMPPKFQLLAVLAFGVAMLFIENQIQNLEDSRAKLGKFFLFCFSMCIRERTFCMRLFAVWAFSAIFRHIPTCL